MACFCSNKTSNPSGMVCLLNFYTGNEDKATAITHLLKPLSRHLEAHWQAVRPPLVPREDPGLLTVVQEELSNWQKNPSIGKIPADPAVQDLQAGKGAVDVGRVLLADHVHYGDSFNETLHERERGAE